MNKFVLPSKVNFTMSWVCDACGYKNTVLTLNQFNINLEHCQEGGNSSVRSLDLKCTHCKTITLVSLDCPTQRLLERLEK